jgi:hypothetical protein
VRYAALACVIAGGTLMSGPGAVALADETSTNGNGSSTGGAPPAGDATTTSTPFKLPTLPGLTGLTSSAASNLPRVGPIAPPAMNLPSWPGSPTASPNVAGLAPFTLFPPDTSPATSTAPPWVAVTVPGFAPGGQMPGDQRQTNASVTGVGSQPAVGGVAAQSQPQQRQGAGPSPTISVVQVVPAGVPAGTPITTTDSSRQALPIDLHQPVLPQVLPPPLVLVLMAIAERVPLAGLVITPLLDFTVPSFLADTITALSNISTSSLDGPMPSTGSLVKPVLSPVGSGPMPLDLAPTGMDVPRAPVSGTPPPPPIPEQSKPPAPTDNVSQLSEQVEFRAGYSDYLRNAGMAQITAIAVPGAVAILLFSVGGGFIGYRQARAGHVIRAEGIGRFLR